MNAKGGVNGYKVNVIVKDDQSSPAVGLQDAKTLIQADHVVALVDATDTESAWADLPKQSDVPVVGGFNLSVDDITNSNFFATGTTEDASTLARLLGAKKVHATKIAESLLRGGSSLSGSCGPEVHGRVPRGERPNRRGNFCFTTRTTRPQCLAAKQAGATYERRRIGERRPSDGSGIAPRQGYFPWYQIADGGVSRSFTNAVGLNTKSFGYQTGLPFFNRLHRRPRR